MNNAVLNVNAADLINAADMFEESGVEVSELTAEMMDLVVGLSAAWEGDAAEMYISKFTALDDDIERMLRMINEHVADLYEMAFNYADAEDEILSAEEILSTDVII